MVKLCPEKILILRCISPPPHPKNKIEAPPEKKS